MYIIERLKRDYPQHSEMLDVYDRFLRIHVSEENLVKIYNDEKENFYWVNEAFKCGPGTAGYNKNMAYYSMAINFDIDFLRSLVDNSENMTVEELRKKLIGEYYDPAYDKRILEKIKIKEHND